MRRLPVLQAAAIGGGSMNEVIYFVREEQVPSKASVVPTIWVAVSKAERAILELASKAVRTSPPSLLAHSAVCFAHQCGFYAEGATEVRRPPFWAPLPARVTVDVIGVNFVSSILLGLVQHATDYVVVVSDGKLHRIPVSEFILGSTFRILRQRQAGEVALRSIQLPVLDDFEAQRKAFPQ